MHLTLQLLYAEFRGFITKHFIIAPDYLIVYVCLSSELSQFLFKLLDAREDKTSHFLEFFLGGIVFQLLDHLLQVLVVSLGVQGALEAADVRV